MSVPTSAIAVFNARANRGHAVTCSGHSTRVKRQVTRKAPIITQ